MSAATEFAPTRDLPAVSLPAPRLSAVPSVPMPATPPAPGAPSRVASVTVLHRPQAAAHAAPVRLTRRGVVVLTTVVLALGAALFAIAASSSAAGAGARSSDPHIQAVTVAPGDTLWSIASRVAPDRDPRAEVSALQRRNHLSGVGLTPGQHLVVP